MDNPDRAEMRALCDQFRELMARENDVLLFDRAAKERIGQTIGRAAGAGPALLFSAKLLGDPSPPG